MKENQNHVIDLLFTLTLFGVFAASALLVVFFGARIYQNTVSDMNQNFTSRTAVSYVSEKLRQRDAIGAMKITQVEDASSIALIRQYDSYFITTYIYSDEGYLKELNMSGTEQPTKAAGQKIMELSDFSIEETSEGIYHIVVVDSDGTTEEAFLSAKCDPEIGGSAIAGPGDDLDGGSIAGPDEDLDSGAIAGPVME